MKHTLESVTAALREANHALANDEAACQDILRICVNHDEHQKRPYYIYDSATGEKLGMSQQVVYEKRLKAFGNNILAMFATYKGRASKKNAVPVAQVEVIVPEVVEKSKSNKRKKKGDAPIIDAPETVTPSEAEVLALPENAEVTQ